MNETLDRVIQKQVVKRAKMCQRANFHSLKPVYTLFNFIVGLDLLEFSFFIILPVLFGSFGIFTNIIVIRVVFDKNNKETIARNITYTWDSIVSRISLFASFHSWISSASVSIPTVGYPDNFRRSIYLGFSICRLAKIGTNHSKFTVFVNEKLSIKVFMVVVVIVSAGLSVCKCLQFDLNYDRPDLSYPLPFTQNTDRYAWRKKSDYVAIFVIIIIYNFVNYFMFVWVHLIVDLVLTRKLAQVMRKKEKRKRAAKMWKSCRKRTKNRSVVR